MRKLKKLFKDTCGKMIYQQLDGVSMGRSLCPFVPNIIYKELGQHNVVQEFICDKILLFYGHYVDDT